MNSESESVRKRLAAHASAYAEMPTVCAEDALKYAAAILTERISWTTEAIGCSEECGHGEQCGDDVHRDELEAIDAVVREIRSFAARFGDSRRYSDGRMIIAHAEIVRGFVAEHIWHPSPAEEQPQTRGGEVPSFDPNRPSPGRYQVSSEPATQTLHVRVMRAVANG